MRALCENVGLWSPNPTHRQGSSLHHRISSRVPLAIHCLACRHLVDEVSHKGVRVFGAGNKTRILAVDCGIKYNMIRMLVER